MAEPCLPSHWENRTSGTAYLQVGSPEYVMLQRAWDGPALLAAVRVEIPHLWRSYNESRLKSPWALEQRVWFGSSREHLLQVLQHGLPHDTVFWHSGSTALAKSVADDKGEKHVLVCRAIETELLPCDQGSCRIAPGACYVEYVVTCKEETSPAPLPVERVQRPALSTLGTADPVPRPIAAVPGHAGLENGPFSRVLLALRCAETLFNVDQAIARPPQSLPAELAGVLCTIYTEMLNNFGSVCYISRYHGTPADNTLLQLRPGQPVPAYFANTGGESIFRRKALSIAGLRNLILFGPEIFCELRSKLFIGNPEAYQPGEGIHKMKLFTGNVVDLDTCVLRPSDRSSFHALNTMLQRNGLHPYPTIEAFSSSDHAKQIVFASAVPLLDEFAAEFRLNYHDRLRRCVHIPDSSQPIPRATHNMHRGKWPIWHYVNCGVNSFHVNVPSLTDVVGALLRAPLHCLRAYVQCSMQNRLEDFYEDCIVDSCFNAKWKAIEAFLVGLQSEGSINEVLAKLQANNQETFTQAFFDADDGTYSAEVAEMMRLVVRERSTGRDKDGHLRPITEADIRQWVADQNTPI
eukprot:TRINITY_DN8966_c0_g1_i1.p1 TRINITY_DN8966_c0_g1~~TRINITY_DN8966_c0_g1_i1.p1  ORF type:complete len:584 (-),score=55.64 TRINITY_DN8966_c0_g1_i1:120-1850(-)